MGASIVDSGGTMRQALGTSTAPGLLLAGLAPRRPGGDVAREIEEIVAGIEEASGGDPALAMEMTIAAGLRMAFGEGADPERRKLRAERREAERLEREATVAALRGARAGKMARRAARARASRGEGDAS